MAYPFAVDASDNFIYVADPGNVTVLRYEKRFALDNQPGLSIERHVAVKGQITLSAAPNPFGSECRVRVTLPQRGNVVLEVVDISGRLVSRITSGMYAAGVRDFSWNGTRLDGIRAAAGVYIYRLSTDRGVKTVRTILAR
jgi:hypothetical protein